MRTEIRSCRASWPKTVVKKWLNIKSRTDEFHSDYGVIGVMEDRRRKSCSDRGQVLFRKGDILLPVGGGGFVGGVSAVSESQDLRMFVGTWNVGGKEPQGDLNLKDWLISTHTPADIYVLGFQEIVPLNAGNVLGAENNSPAEKWLSLVRKALNNSDKRDTELGQDYRRVASLDDPEPNQKARVSFSDILALENTWEDEDLQINVADLFQSGLSRSSSRKSASYCLAASKQMVGLFLCVWVRSDLGRYISDLKVSCVGRGIMGYMGNKGSVSISMTLHQTTFCFVCSHLTSGEKEGDELRRNSDVMEIIKKTRFSRSCRLPGLAFSPYSILQHDKIIWLGDLNYRLASAYGYTHELLQKNDWQGLLEKDQLQIEQQAGRVFKGWEEGRIHFAPTYKYLANSDRYAVETAKSREKRRTPAWCDRILWRGQGIKQMSYGRYESRFSDHRPVYSFFSVHMDHSSISTTTRTNPDALNILPLLSSSSCSRRIQAEEQLLAPPPPTCHTPISATSRRKAASSTINIPSFIPPLASSTLSYY